MDDKDRILNDDGKTRRRQSCANHPMIPPSALSSSIFEGSTLADTILLEPQPPPVGYDTPSSKPRLSSGVYSIGNEEVILLLVRGGPAAKRLR